MPQPPPKLWKKSIYKAVAFAEHLLRDGKSQSQIDPSRIRNFLFLQYDLPLGSIVHATPVFETLKRAMPNAHVTVAASNMAASVLRNNPYIDRCAVTPNPALNFKKSISAVRELLRAMPGGPRAIVTTIGNRRPRITLLSSLAGNAAHIGHTAAPELYNLPLTFCPARGQIEGNLDILRSVGHDVSFAEPRMFFTQQDAEYAARLMAAEANREDAPRIAFVTHNSGGQRNRWIQDRFQHLIAQLTQDFGAAPIFLGTSADAAAIEGVRRPLVSPGISAVGKTTVPQLAALLALCDLIISLDTGTFHVARAIALPGVVIAPAWQNPMEWLPVDHPQYRIVRGPSIATAPPKYCMEEISVEQVVDAASELMEKLPVSRDARRMRLERGLKNVKSS